MAALRVELEMTSAARSIEASGNWVASTSTQFSTWSSSAVGWYIGFCRWYTLPTRQSRCCPLLRLHWPPAYCHNWYKLCCIIYCTLDSCCRKPRPISIVQSVIQWPIIWTYTESVICECKCAVLFQIATQNGRFMLILMQLLIKLYSDPCTWVVNSDVSSLVCKQGTR